MWLGGVFVMMNSDSTSSTMTIAVAPYPVVSAISGAPRSQPRMPPAMASEAMPSDGAGPPPKMWHSALTEISSTPRPMPMRPLSFTDDGCRNSQIANSSMMTGSA